MSCETDNRPPLPTSREEHRQKWWRSTKGTIPEWQRTDREEQKAWQRLCAMHHGFCRTCGRMTSAETAGGSEYCRGHASLATAYGRAVRARDHARGAIQRLQRMQRAGVGVRLDIASQERTLAESLAYIAAAKDGRA